MCCKIPTLLITDDFPSSLDTRFDWSKYIQKTKTTFNYRLSLLKNFFGKSSKLVLKTKMSIYNFLLKPIWINGIQHWDTARKSN